MTDEDADFLKRKNKWNPELECWMGALDEESIFKSLHSNLKSKVVTKEEVSMQCIDGALREFFPHGEEIYEKRRAELNEVAKAAGISHGCRELGVTYPEALQRWKDKYGKEKQD